MRKIISLISAVIISAVSFASLSNADSKKPIVIPTHNWSSQIGAMAALVDIDKMTHEDAAKKWLKDNEKVWKAFTK